MGVGCIFAQFNARNVAMSTLHSCFCVCLELAMITIGAPSSMPYLTLPFCLSTMFFSVFAFRTKQERARQKRRAEAEKTQKNSKGDRDITRRMQSIRGAPRPLDVDEPTAAVSQTPYQRVTSLTTAESQTELEMSVS